jgi:hypothetical protein
MIDEKTGWAVGNSGTILEYSCINSTSKNIYPFPKATISKYFPNPATNQITLSIPNEQNINSISIFNSLGMEVKRIEQTEILGQNKITISIENLPVGLYHCLL